MTDSTASINTDINVMHSLGLPLNFIIYVRRRLNAWTKDDVISCDLEVSDVSGDGFDIVRELLQRCPVLNTHVIIIRDCPVDVFTIIKSVNIFCM